MFGKTILATLTDDGLITVEEASIIDGVIQDVSGFLRGFVPPAQPNVFALGARVQPNLITDRMFEPLTEAGAYRVLVDYYRGSIALDTWFYGWVMRVMKGHGRIHPSGNAAQRRAQFRKLAKSAVVRNKVAPALRFAIEQAPQRTRTVFGSPVPARGSFLGQPFSLE